MMLRHHALSSIEAVDLNISWIAEHVSSMRDDLLEWFESNGRHRIPWKLKALLSQKMKNMRKKLN